MNKVKPIIVKTKNIRIVLILFLTVISLIVSAKNTNPEIPKSYQRIDASYIIGGQLYNDNFIYNPGYGVQTTYGFYINKDIAFGLGVGYQSLENENFIPMYAEVIGFKKHKSNSPYIKMQMGYSLGWNKSFPDNINYEYSGGPFIDIGMGRKITLKNNYAISFQWSYRHQFAELEYDTYGATKYSQSLNYDMLVITIGVYYENR